jgi:hypothetical protein
LKGIRDRAPNTDASDGCAEPETADEVLDLRLTETCNVVGGSCIVFVTSTTHTGNLGGLAGADQICQALADQAQLGGTFKAWLSDSTTNARDRLTRAKVPYMRTDNVQVAVDFTDLTDGGLAAPLLVDERGLPLTATTRTVWTATRTDGTRCPLVVNNPLLSCNDWAPSTGHAPIGNAGRPDATWTQVGTECDGTQSCAQTGRLYCFEQ